MAGNIQVDANFCESQKAIRMKFLGLNLVTATLCKGAAWHQ